MDSGTLSVTSVTAIKKPCLRLCVGSWDLSPEQRNIIYLTSNASSDDNFINAKCLFIYAK